MPVERIVSDVQHIQEKVDPRSPDSRAKYDEIRAKIAPLSIPTREDLRKMPTPPLAPLPKGLLVRG